MNKWKLAGSAAVVALVAACPALADITPEEVWQNWKDWAGKSGQTVAATSETRNGDVLMIEGATFTMDDSQGGTVTIPKIALKDLGDGTVEVTTPDPMTINVTPPEGGEGSELVMELTAPAMTTIVSGTVDAANSALTIPEMKITVISADGQTFADAGNDVSFVIRNATTTYAANGDQVASDLSAEAMDIVVKVTDPAGGNVNFTATMAALAGSGTTTMPEGVNMADTAAALAAGFATDNKVTFGKTDFSFDMTDATGTGSAKGTIAGGGMNIAMDAGKIGMGTVYNGLDITVSGSTIPMPELKIGLGEAGFNLVMPVAKSDTPGDFAFLTKIVDLTIPDEVWGMVDPAANLPREPITMVLDTTGTAKLSVDITDEAAMAAMGDAPPGELNSLDLKELRLSAAGAEVQGSGALTFDNTDVTTFQGMPKPTGELTFSASGINGLLDKITAMGLVPEDQLMGARMMMGMFAKPGEGEDTLISLVEFKDGGLFVNGMQLQ